MAAIDVNIASDARMYDMALGGTDNYVSDRIAFRQLEELVPDLETIYRENRDFVERVVTSLASDGAHQFLDLGCGIPSPRIPRGPTRNYRADVHYLARHTKTRRPRVVYVDHDPVAWAHARTVLDGRDTGVIRADITDPDTVFEHKTVQNLLDLDRPLVVLLTAVLHCLPEATDPTALVRAIAHHLAPGSHLVISHLVADQPAIRRRFTDHMTAATAGAWGRVRERHHVEALFTDLDVLAPGIVEVSKWRSGPESYRRTSHNADMYGGVGHKR